VEILHLLVAHLSLSSIASSSTPGPSSVEREKRGCLERRGGGVVAGETVVQSVPEEAAGVLAKCGCPLVCVGVCGCVWVWVCLCVCGWVHTYICI
jgi:hypothetical protein